jgi:predicted helicase
VSINIFIKTGKKQRGTLGEVFHAEVYGKRKEKYAYLYDHTVQSVAWQKIDVREPDYTFIYRDYVLEEAYKRGFSISNLFQTFGSGTNFRKDNLLLKRNFSKDDAIKMINDIVTLPNLDLLSKYDFNETSDWKIDEKKQFFLNSDHNDIRRVLYRPFDYRFTYYPTSRISNIIPRGDSRVKLMRHMIFENNIGISFNRQIEVKRPFNDIFVCYGIFEKHGLSMKENNSFAPLYLYSDNSALEQTRTPNLNSEIVEQIAHALHLRFTDEPEEGDDTFAPIDLLDYIYAVLHSPQYRERYAEFLKIDFPRVPYPDPATFRPLVALGGQLRELHLLESPLLKTRIIDVNDGTNEITRKIVKKDTEITDDHVKVWLNDTQYITGISLLAWEAYIGGYQPAQKWLKDRTGRILSHNDFKHYNRIMHEIDEVMEAAVG